MTFFIAKLFIQTVQGKRTPQKGQSSSYKALVYLPYKSPTRRSKECMYDILVNAIDSEIRSLCFFFPYRKLHYLELFDLPGVRDREAVLEHFNQLLPTCKVDFPDVNETTKPKK